MNALRHPLSKQKAQNRCNETAALQTGIFNFAAPVLVSFLVLDGDFTYLILRIQ